MESPSSCVISTKDHIVPHFSSTGLNCGMTVFKTSLTESDLTPDRLDRFMNKAKALLPMSTKTPDVSSDDILAAAADGAEWASSRYDVEPEIGEFVENGGKAGSLTKREVKAMSTGPLVDKSRYNFAQLGGGNHFFEMQVVDDVMSPDEAHSIGLSKGQVVIMFHGGPGSLGLLGRIFARREYTSLRHKLKLIPVKLLVHKTLNPTKLLRRYRYYFGSERHIAIPASSEEGLRIRDSIDATMNIGAAFRIAVYSRARAFLRSAFGDSVETNLLYDSPHNSIYEEEWKGEKRWVHRQNAPRMLPSQYYENHHVFSQTGQLSLIPGNHVSNSHLVVAGTKSSESMHSVNHGFGETIERLDALNMIPKDDLPDTSTQRYRAGTSEPEILRHIHPSAVQRGIQYLSDAEIIRPVVSLRPVANIRG
jgi:tRNA-splicing ligase RtcB